MKTLLALLLLIPSLCWGLDKNELKEELKYWKSLLDDELISQEDYNRKKEELINLSIPSNQVSDTKQITQSSTNEQKNYYFNGYELNSNQIKIIQTKLKSLGWDISVDGVLGRQTKKTIREWLECNNFKTSSFNDVSFNSLRETKKPCRVKFTTAQSETKSEDKKSLPSGYNAFVSHIQTPLCVNRRYLSNCGTKLGLLKEGDYLKIVNIHVDNGKLKEFLVATEKLGVGFVSADHVEVPDKNFLKIKFGYTEINEKDLSHIYDAIVTGHNVKLCHSRYYQQCENYNVRKTLEKGDYLNIKDEKIIYGQSLVHVSTQNNNSGFVSKYDIKIFEPDKFEDSRNTQNYSKSKTTTSSNNTTYETSSNTTKTSVNNSNENDKEISNLNNEIQKLKNKLSKTDKTNKKNCKRESPAWEYWRDKKCKTKECKDEQVRDLRSQLSKCGGYGKSDEDIFYEALGGVIMSIFD